MSDWETKAESCPSRARGPLLPRPGNALNIEIGAPLPRCLNRPPADWPPGMALRWRGSGGSSFVFGLCREGACPLKLTTDSEIIRRAVETSGLSARQFAVRIMGRDERTIRRWSSGDIAIPPVAKAWLEHWLTLSDHTRERIVGALK